MQRGQDNENQHTPQMPLEAKAGDDTIEKEWVDRVKATIEGTRSNPYQQYKELAKIKAEFLKKLHGKELKIGDE